MYIYIYTYVSIYISPSHYPCICIYTSISINLYPSLSIYVHLLCLIQRVNLFATRPASKLLFIVIYKHIYVYVYIYVSISIFPCCSLYLCIFIYTSMSINIYPYMSPYLYLLRFIEGVDCFTSWLSSELLLVPLSLYLYLKSLNSLPLSRSL